MILVDVLGYSRFSFQLHVNPDKLSTGCVRLRTASPKVHDKVGVAHEVDGLHVLDVPSEASLPHDKPLRPRLLRLLCRMLLLHPTLQVQSAKNISIEVVEAKYLRSTHRLHQWRLVGVEMLMLLLCSVKAERRSFLCQCTLAATTKGNHMYPSAW